MAKMTTKANDPDKLRVYLKALEFAAFCEPHVSSWPTRFAVADQLSRSADSIVLNLAEATSLWTRKARARAVDQALGSALECAACLDVAYLRGLLSHEPAVRGKARASEIAAMLVGMKSSWPAWLKEDAVPYGPAHHAGAPTIFFAHERLDVYQVSLAFVRWFHVLSSRAEAAVARLREIDTAATSLALNIAEGNGRFSELDHSRFLRIAQTAAARASGHLDLAEAKGIFAAEDTQTGQELLRRTATMLVRLTNRLRQPAD